MSRQTGAFYLPHSFVFWAEDVSRQIFERLKFIPYRVRQEYEHDRIKFVGNSVLFEEVESGVICPVYGINIETGWDKESSIKREIINFELVRGTRLFNWKRDPDEAPKEDN